MMTRPTLWRTPESLLRNYMWSSLTLLPGFVEQVFQSSMEGQFISFLVESKINRRVYIETPKGPCKILTENALIRLPHPFHNALIDPGDCRPYFMSAKPSFLQGLLNKINIFLIPAYGSSFVTTKR